MIEINFYNDYSEVYDNYLELYQKLGDITLKILDKSDNYEISVTFVDNQKIQQLNREYRDKDYPTDVISFDVGLEEGYDDIIDLGDIFISIDKAVEQAKEYSHSIERELMFLFVHGLLHCFGYDHLNEEEERRMFSLQEEILYECKKELQS